MKELFIKDLEVLYTCLLVDNNLGIKLVSSWKSPSTFDEIFKITTSVPFFISDFDLFNCQLNNFTFKVFYWVSFCWCYIEMK